ncbi:MAG: hypothetical protein JWN71_2619 [Xanthobacteraceae bacterium]|nr:hypothetical protein [Xanthobacteraceae bacterium]
MLRRVFLYVMSMIALSVVMADTGVAQERRALVIGVDAYQNVHPLQKAVGDAKAMQSTLQRLGFSADIALNPDRRAFNVAVSNFLNKLKPGDVALLHFSGHGVALDGDNFLLPADVPRPGAGDKELLKSESMSLTSLIERIRQSGARTQILIIDACRDNPYAQTGSRAYGSRGGLMAVPPPRGSGGIFVMYSAGFGQTAADRLSDTDPEPTSVYTRTLLKKITVEGKSITDLAREVREDVEALVAPIGQEQRPAYYDELSGPPFYFVAPRAVAAGQNPGQAQGLDLTYWNSIKDARVAVLYRDYLDRFGDKATFGAIARERLREIEASAPTLSVPPPSVAPPVVPPSREAAPATQPNATQPNAPPPSPAVANFQPSFDCRTSTGADERAICADVGLAARDRILSQLYYRIADAAPAERRVQLRNEQRGWLSQRRTCIGVGNVADCIARAYDTRVAELQRLAGVPAEPALASLQRSTSEGSSAPAMSAQPMSAPSFDCQGKLAPIEKTICQDGVLGAKDRALSELYARLSKQLSGGARQSLTDAQRGWIRLRNQCQGNDTGCIGREYDRRIAELRSALGGR